MSPLVTYQVETAASRFHLCCNLSFVLTCLPRISVQNRLSDDVVLEDDYEWRGEIFLVCHRALSMSRIELIADMCTANAER